MSGFGEPTGVRAMVVEGTRITHSRLFLYSPGPQKAPPALSSLSSDSSDESSYDPYARLVSNVRRYVQEDPDGRLLSTQFAERLAALSPNSTLVGAQKLSHLLSHMGYDSVRGDGPKGKRQPRWKVRVSSH